MSRYLGRKSGRDILTPLQISWYLATLPQRPGVKPGDCSTCEQSRVRLSRFARASHGLMDLFSVSSSVYMLADICFCVDNFPGKPEPKKFLNFFSSRTERLAIALSPFIHILVFLLRARFPSETPFSSLCQPSSRNPMTNTESLADSRIQL